MTGKTCPCFSYGDANMLRHIIRYGIIILFICHIKSVICKGFLRQHSIQQPLKFTCIHLTICQYICQNEEHISRKKFPPKYISPKRFCNSFIIMIFCKLWTKILTFFFQTIQHGITIDFEYKFSKKYLNIRAETLNLDNILFRFLD